MFIRSKEIILKVLFKFHLKNVLSQKGHLKKM